MYTHVIHTSPDKKVQEVFHPCSHQLSYSSFAKKDDCVDHEEDDNFT